MSKNVVIFCLALLTILGWIFYISEKSKDNIKYEDQINVLNKKIEVQESIISSTQIERDLLKIELKNTQLVKDSLYVYRAKYDSLRKVGKNETIKNHSRIDNSNLYELSGIISGFIEE